MGLTLRLFLLCLVALGPAIVAQAYNEYTMRRDREIEVHQQSLDQARLAAADLERIFEGVHNLLLAVSKAPSVIGRNMPACNAFLASLQPEAEHLVSIGVIDRNGRLWCRHPAAPPGLDLSDRGYFKEALAGEGFVVGEHTVARVAGEPVLPMALPVSAAGDRVDGVVVAALKLSWLTQQLRDRGYPEGGSVTVADRNGTILAREPYPERFVGTVIPADFRHLLTADRPGTLEVTSQDGTRRVLGYVPGTDSPGQIYVSFGTPSRQAFAAVRAATTRNIALLGIALVLALIGAWLAGRIFVKGPVDRLLAATEAWGGGDLGARTGLKDGGGELSRIGAAFDRVAGEVQRRSEALKESEERSRLAIEATGIGIWDVDVPAGSRRWSPEFRKIIGLSMHAEADLRVFSDLIHPEDRDWVDAVYRKAYEPGGDGRYEAEFRIRRADDDAERWVVTGGRVTFDEKGRAIRGVGTIRDITERKNADTALRESEARLRSLADNLPNGLVFQLVAGGDGERRFLYVSEGVERMIGPKSEEVLRDAGVLYGPIHPDDLPRLAAAEAAALRDGKLFNIEVRMHRADGVLRWFQLASASRRLSDGSVVWDGVALDVTDRALAEQAIRTANDTLEARVAERTEELAAANRELVSQIEEREKVEATLRQMQRLEAVGQLTSGVAHDFNNLLTVILGNLEFLARAEPDPQQRRRIDMMRAAAERGARLTQQLLAFSRRQRLEPRQLDLNEILVGMQDLLTSTIGGSVRLDVRFGPDLWPALVDPTQIELVILNLAINARDAMPVGGTLIVATANVRETETPRRPEEPPPGDYVRISVRDCGSGMPPEVLAKAFEPFFTTKDVGKGSGLGLAQVYGFAKQSRGGVRIETALGEGTVVHVFLPRAEPSSVSAAPGAPAAGAAASTTSVGATILLVDDDAAVRSVTAGLLAELGFQVREAASGEAALAALSPDEAIDLILLDFAMPDMNGADLARAIRHRRCAAPIVFLTGYADFAALDRVGEEHVVRKPFRSEELLRVIEAILARGDAGRTAAVA